MSSKRRMNQEDRQAIRPFTMQKFLEQLNALIFSLTFDVVSSSCKAQSSVQVEYSKRICNIHLKLNLQGTLDKQSELQTREWGTQQRQFIHASRSVMKNKPLVFLRQLFRSC